MKDEKILGADAAEVASAGSSAPDQLTHAAPTPGPWGIERFPDAIEVVGRGDMSAVVAIIGARAGSQTAEADAHLVAAAPEMRHFIAKWLGVGSLQTFEDRERFRAEGAILLAKAEGRTR